MSLPVSPALKKETSPKTAPGDLSQLSLFPPIIEPGEVLPPVAVPPSREEPLLLPAKAASTSNLSPQEDAAGGDHRRKQSPIVPAMAVWAEPGMIAWPFVAPPQDLLRTLERCVDRLVQTGVSSRNEGFWQLIFLLCAKQYEEIQGSNDRQFYADPKEAKKPQRCQEILDRVLPVFEHVKKAYPDLFTSEDTLHLRPEVLGPLVSHLGEHPLLDTELDPFGAAYQQWAGAWAREWRAQFFTPLSVAFFVVSLLQPQVHERVLDPTCGAGVFFRALHTYRRFHIRSLAALTKDEKPQANEVDCSEQVTRYMQQRVYGADLDRDLVRIAQLQLTLLGGSPTHVYEMDSLHFPHNSDNAVPIGDIPLGSMDVVVGNPPFALPITDPAILQQYELARVFKRQGESGSHSFQKTEKLQKKVSSEILFLEQALKWLKPGGRMGIVLNDGLLSNSASEYARFWLLRHAFLLASISLPAETFQAQSRTGVKTSILLLRKMTEAELEDKQQQRLDYSIYMAEVEDVGYDSRGRTLYKRTPSGELVEKDGTRQINNELPEVLADFWRFYNAHCLTSSPQDTQWQ